MHTIEPYYNWRGFYIASEDIQSPFYGREYSEFEFTDKIYNYCIHPQWDNIGSPTLFIKILFADYDEGFCIIEMFGEWNDAVENDIMFFKRDIVELLMEAGINKFILIAENVLNFHSDSDDYYEEWFEEVEENDGWIAILNLRQHVLDEMKTESLDQYFVLGGDLEDFSWRTMTPQQFYSSVERYVMKRLA
ncbi:MAG: hypothetical protein H6582_07865 [Crocinitomicaceae bacterium]|nr:hypothetical protein [Crocinitomicaceae bacterium]